MLLLTTQGLLQLLLSKSQMPLTFSPTIQIIDRDMRITSWLGPGENSMMTNKTGPIGLFNCLWSRHPTRLWRLFKSLLRSKSLPRLRAGPSLEHPKGDGCATLSLPQSAKDVELTLESLLLLYQLFQICYQMSTECGKLTMASLSLSRITLMLVLPHTLMERSSAKLGTSLIQSILSIDLRVSQNSSRYLVMMNLWWWIGRIYGTMIWRGRNTY